MPEQAVTVSVAMYVCMYLQDLSPEDCLTSLARCDATTDTAPLPSPPTSPPSSSDDIPNPTRREGNTMKTSYSVHNTLEDTLTEQSTIQYSIQSTITICQCTIQFVRSAKELRQTTSHNHNLPATKGVV